MHHYLLEIRSLLDSTHKIATTDRFRGFYVSSTAPVNVEDPPSAEDKHDEPLRHPELVIDEMADFLEQHPGQAEIVVLVHGYNTNRHNIQHWYKETAAYMAQQQALNPHKALIFLGYRWPSETTATSVGDSINAAGAALPSLLNGIVRSSQWGIAVALVGICLSIGLILTKSINFLSLLLSATTILGIACFVIAPILTLLGLRLSNYFRDTYRANQYGVADLIELIRRIDRRLLERNHCKAHEGWELDRRIRLSFIGHSMGAFVVTQAVRTLSDVFDECSIETLDLGDRTTPPNNTIGHVFKLGRLVLVAPDISAESIISGRANVLRSSIRRFEEAYLFSNEGDMALRLASTVANYFSFPTRTRDGGYRLGNVTVRKRDTKCDRVEQYGIVNLDQDGTLLARERFLEYLFIRRSYSLKERQEAIWGKDQTNQKALGKSIAELFTYIDCTDYRETVYDAKTQRSRHKGIVSLAKGKTGLDFWDLCAVTIAFMRRQIDPHGGYLFCAEATFSKQMIYGLACGGLAGYLEQFDHPEQLTIANPRRNPTQQQRLAQLQRLSQKCDNYGIQMLLAPERYNVDVLQGKPNRQGY
jgi:pimeloyl-ACP methyl ester carboxylesterase